jgi:hypothetical protein
MSFVSLSESEPVARKPHRCIWCGEEITKGVKHFHYTGKFDGDFQSNRLHLECWKPDPANRQAQLRADCFPSEDGAGEGTIVDHNAGWRPAEPLPARKAAPGKTLSDAELLQITDAKVWAEQFCLATGYPDEGMALSWFANAMMAEFMRLSLSRRVE